RPYLGEQQTSARQLGKRKLELASGRALASKEGAVAEDQVLQAVVVVGLLVLQGEKNRQWKVSTDFRWGTSYPKEWPMWGRSLGRTHSNESSSGNNNRRNRNLRPQFWPEVEGGL